MRLPKLLTVGLLLSLTFSSQAAIIDIDWKVAGDNRAFLEVESGTEWLDVSETSGLSLVDAASLIVTGGIYEGFRIASETEVNYLFDTLFTPSNQYSEQVYSAGDYFKTFSASDVALVGNNVASMGVVVDHPAVFATGGTYYNDQNQASVMFKQQRSAAGEARVFNNTQFASIAAEDNQTLYGVYLVSDGGATYSTINDPSLVANNTGVPNATEVSEPGALALLGLGLAGLLVRRKV